MGMRTNGESEDGKSRKLWSRYDARQRVFLSRLQGNDLEKLVDEWIMLHPDQKGKRESILSDILFYADYLITNLDQIETKSCKNTDIESFRRAQQIQAQYKEIIFSGEKIPETVFAYENIGEQITQKPTTRSGGIIHKILARFGVIFHSDRTDRHIGHSYHSHYKPNPGHAR